MTKLFVICVLALICAVGLVVSDKENENKEVTEVRKVDVDRQVNS